jgi:hypothetical protein
VSDCMNPGGNLSTILGWPMSRYAFRVEGASDFMSPGGRESECVRLG